LPSHVRRPYARSKDAAVKDMSRKPRPLAALAMVALIGAGCSNGSAENGTTGAGSSGGNENTNRDKSVQFADCMRDNGVTEYPDPNASGGDQEFVEAINKLDPSSAAWKTAIGACKDLQPAGLLGGKASPQEMSERLEFARCMRANGVEDFPDPTQDGPLIDTRRIPSAAGRGARSIPGFQDAMEKCRDPLAGALGGE
jgi:hypothetical protein